MTYLCLLFQKVWQISNLTTSQKGLFFFTVFHPEALLFKNSDSFLHSLHPIPAIPEGIQEKHHHLPQALKRKYFPMPQGKKTILTLGKTVSTLENSILTFVFPKVLTVFPDANFATAIPQKTVPVPPQARRSELFFDVTVTMQAFTASDSTRGSPSSAYPKGRSWRSDRMPDQPARCTERTSSSPRSHPGSPC